MDYITLRVQPYPTFQGYSREQTLRNTALDHHTSLLHFLFCNLHFLKPQKEAVQNFTPGGWMCWQWTSEQRWH